MKMDHSQPMSVCYFVQAAIPKPKPKEKPKIRVATIQFEGARFRGVVNSHAEVSVIPQKGNIAKLFSHKTKPAGLLAIHHGKEVVRPYRKVRLEIKPIYADGCQFVAETFFILPKINNVCEYDFILSRHALKNFRYKMVDGIKPKTSTLHPNGMIFAEREETDTKHDGIIQTSNNMNFIGLQCNHLTFKLLKRYPESIFSPITPESHIRMNPMEIKTFEDGPKVMFTKNFSNEEIKIMKSEVKDLIGKGVLEFSYSDWNSVPKLVQKKDKKSFRLVLNCCLLNNITQPMLCRPPLLKDIVDFCEKRGCTYYSSLDCRQSTYQVELAIQDRHKTAFQTPFGKFQYKRLPFGTRNTTAYFQSGMNRIFKKGLWDRCIIYIDDILVHGRTRAEHDSNLEWVLDLCNKFNIKLHPSKCVIGQKQVDYCGFTIAQNCMPMRSKVDAWLKQPRPQDSVDLHLFLEKLRIYSIFLDEQQDSLDLLRDLVRSDKEGRDLDWTANHIRAYKKILSTLDQLVVGKLVHMPD